MSTDSNERHCIAVWEPSDEGLTLNARAVTADKYASVMTALEEVQNIEINLHFRAAEQNKQALDGLVTALDRRRRVPVSQRQHTPNARRMQTRFLVLLANFLSSARAYFDSTADALAQRHGKDSEAYEAFKAARADAYDASAEYRFFEQLRNVMQHSANLPLGIDTAAEGDTTSARMRLRADKTILLNSTIRWKGIVRADIEQGPDKRDIADDLAQYWEHFVSIERTRVAVAARDAVPAMRLLLDALSSAELPADRPSALIHFVNDEMDALTWGYSQDQYARNIELALAGTAHNPRSSPPRTASEPSGVTAEAHDVMTAWLTGGPDAAAATVNDIAQDIDGVQATVIGLVNMTAISLTQVQAVLGHDIHTMVAEMVDPPPAPESSP